MRPLRGIASRSATVAIRPTDILPPDFPLRELQSPLTNNHGSYRADARISRSLSGKTGRVDVEQLRPVAAELGLLIRP